MRYPKPAPDWRSILNERISELAQVAGNARFNAFILASQNAYDPWEKLRFKARAAALDPALAWLQVKWERVRNARPLPLTDRSGRALTYWLPPTSQEELMLVDQQLAGHIGQATRELVGRELAEYYIKNSLMEEAIASSMLEGAVTTRRDAKQMLREQRPPRTPGERMVANNYQAIGFIREHQGTALTPDFILELHTILTQDTMPADQIGRWRTADDGVNVIDHRDNEIMHEPPPAADLPRRLDALIRFANESIREDGEFVHPVVRAIALHFQFGYEHPFCDGNGRTARALFYWHLLRNKYWLFEFLPLSQLFRRAPARYARAFVYTETDDFDLGYFLTYHLRVIGKARHALLEYLAGEQRKRLQAESTYGRDPRLNQRQKLLLRNLHHRDGAPVTIAEHQHANDLAYATARADLIELEQLGYLSSRKVGKKLVYTPTDAAH